VQIFVLAKHERRQKKEKEKEILLNLFVESADFESVVCYTSYCMRFNNVIFITLMRFNVGSLNILDQLWGIHAYGSLSLHDIISFDSDLWFGEFHFSLVGW
jgi:hypothetical protein